MENNTIKDSETLDIIMAGLLSNDDTAYVKKQEMVTAFSGNMSVFKDEYYAIATMVKENMRLEYTKEFLKLYLKTNRPTFTKSNNINLNKFMISDVDPYDEFILASVGLYEELSKKKVKDADYFRAIEMHKMSHIANESINLLEESVEILCEGKRKRGKNLSGFNDMSTNLKTNLLKLENMLSKSDRKGIITFGVNDEEEEGDSKVKLVTTFGVKELDEHINIYEGDMVSLLAPAKGGKSRFSTSVLHNAVVKHGVNVVMWSIENGYKGWECLLRARHFNYFYNDSATDAIQKRMIDDDMIRKGKMDKELEELELASWTELKTNPNYGTITVIDEDFDSDTFIEVLDNAVNATGAKLICIDYLQLLTAKGKSASKNEVIGDAYKQTLQYLKKKKVAGIFPAQLKQTFVGSLDGTSDEDLINTELRNSAGESYEVIKTPDINLALYATPEDIRNGSMKILSIPSRNSAPFEPINMYVDMGSSSFYSIN